MTEKLEIISEDWDSALAIVAHPDDMEYGAASVVARWTSQGKKVVYLLVTRGEAGIDSMPPERVGPLREDEQRKAAACVGVDIVEFLDYPDGTIEYGLALRRDMARAIRRHRPQLLVTLNHRLTWGWKALNMADHRSVGLAVLDAARDAGNRWIFPELLEEGLKPWSGVKTVCLNGSPRATHAVDITGFIEKGIASLKEHRVYIENLDGEFNPETFLREAATGTGGLIGCQYGVSFEVIQV